MPLTDTYRLPVVFGTVSLVVLLSLSALVQAETKAITSEATYSMGDGETPSFAEAMVLQKAKQRALEEAGTYVESYTHVRNLDLTVDEIKTIAGGVMKTEIIEQNRELEGSGVRFYMKIRALVTTDKIEDLARRIKGGNVAEENKKVLEAYAKLDKDIEALKRQIAATRTDTDREIVLDKIREAERQFRQVRLTETALYKRLVSGEELSEQVNKAFQAKQRLKEEEQKRRDWQNRSLDHLLETLRTNGHTIMIGPPETEVRLDEPGRVWLGFLVTVKTSDELGRAIDDLERAYSGDIQGMAEEQIEKILNSLTVSLSVSLKNGAEYTSGLYTLRFRSVRSYDLKHVFREGPAKTFVRVEIPRQFIEQITSVEGRISSKAPQRSSVSDDLNRELEEELKKIKQFQPAAKLDIPKNSRSQDSLK